MERDLNEIVQILYQAEFVGVPREQKISHPIRELAEFEFAYQAPSPNLNFAGSFMIHPAFWKALELTA